MNEWLAANLGNIIVSLFLISAVLLIIRKLAGEKKRGSISCDCSCGDCTGCQSCMYRTPQGS